MISDSWYWKNTLAKHAETLHVKQRQHRWRAESFLIVEQAVMMSCYIIRKLADARKLSAERFHAPLHLTAFDASGATVDLLNNHRLEELYVLDVGREVAKPLSYLANQMIHSFVFAPVFERPGRLHGVAFNSDRSRGKELYMVDLETLAKVFAACADSSLSHLSYYRIENGEMVVVASEDA